jgi:hypothetical protein
MNLTAARFARDGPRSESRRYLVERWASRRPAILGRSLDAPFFEHSSTHPSPHRYKCASQCRAYRRYPHDSEKDTTPAGGAALRDFEHELFDVGAGFCGVVSNGCCCDVSALTKPAFNPSAPPLPPPKAAIACTSCEVESPNAPMAPPSGSGGSTARPSVASQPRRTGRAHSEGVRCLWV